MRANVRAMWWVLSLSFCGLFTVFMIFAYYQTKGDREDREGYAELSATRESLHSVYQKLMIDKVGSTNKEAVTLRSEDVRRALARGTNDLGELPAFLTGDRVYIAKESAPLNSGKFVCFVYLGKRQFPFGLTTNGECRYAEAGEVKKEDFAPFRP